jgi:hypothetical protein
MEGMISVQIERPPTSTNSSLECGGGGGSSSSGQRECDCEFECKCERSEGGGQKLLPTQSSSSSRSPTSQFELDNMTKTNMNATHQTRDFNRSKKKISWSDEDDETLTLTLNDNEDKAEDVVVCADKSDNFGFAELVNDIVNLTAEDFGMSDFVESILSPVADATESMCSPHDSTFTDMLQDDAVATVSGALSKELHDLIFEYFPEEEATAAEDVGVGEVVREVIIRGEDVDVSPGQHLGKDVDENIAPCFRIPSTIDVKDGVTPPDPDTKRGNDCCCWWWRKN